MDRRAISREDEALTLRAAEWMLELQRRDVDMERILAWQSWMTADPRHKEAFDRLQAVEECVGRIESPPWPTDSEVANDRSDDAATVSAPPSKHDRMRRRPRRLPLARLAAGLLAVAIATSILAPRAGLDVASLVDLGDSVITTEVGELRRVQLSDGSKVTLGGATRVSIDMSVDTRRIDLERGEAFFEVAKDPNRPFLVEVDHAAIRAVGTAFDVRRAGSQVSVSVAEGVVEVAKVGGTNAPESPSESPTRIVAGQSIQFEPTHIRAPALIAIEPETIATWRSGQRQYLAEPLANVVADLNRYSTRRIAIDDPALGELAITGSIFERDIERWVKSLEVALPVTVENDGDALIIRAR